MIISKEAKFYTYVEDINYVRAIAVLAVIAGHVCALSSGFIGVDIFFTISGYVITLNILKNKYDTGNFNFLDFSESRISRIVPALLVVTAFTWFATLWIPFEAKDNAYNQENLLWQSFFAQNFFYYFESTDYFGGLPEAKPFLHLWSIAVEEQFYIFFPLFFLFLKKLRTLFISILTVFLILVFSMEEIEGLVVSVLDKGNSYYLIFNRIWEFLIGSLFCFVSLSIYKSKLVESKWYGIFFRIVSAVCFLLLFVLVSVDLPKDVWPNKSTLAICFITSILLLSLHLGVLTGSRLIESRILSYIGKSSYSLYLYHWPIYSLIKYTNYQFGSELYDYVVYALILFTLSHLSYKLVERNRPKGWFALGILVLLILGSYLMGSVNVKDQYDKGRISEVRDAGRYAKLKSCQSCTENPSKEFMVLWGDSHAIALVEAFDDYAQSNNLEVVLIRSLMLSDNGVDKYDYFEDLINRIEYKGTILAGRWSMYIGFPENEPQESGNRFLNYKGKNADTRAEAIENFERRLSDFSSRFDTEFVVLLQVPRYPFFPVKELVMEYSGLQIRKPKTKTAGEHYSEHLETSELLRKYLTKSKFVDPVETLCPKSVCIWSYEGLPIYYDDDHLSVVGAKMIFKSIEEVINF